MIVQHYERLSPQERSNRPLKLLQEARSAYHPGRPVFDTIMRMADRNEVYGIIVVHPNRVSRNHADSGSFVQRLVEGQIRCLATTTGQRYTASDSNAIFMLTLESAMSWKDSRDKGERILQAMRMRASEGKQMGPVRIGYRSIFRPDGTKELAIVPEVAPLLRRLFGLAVTGSYSVMDLVREAEKMGLTSRSGKKLAKSAIHSILRDPIYKGFVRFDGIITQGHHSAILDETIWDRVQSLLAGRNVHAGKPKDLTLRELFIFGTMLKCPRCGRTLCAYRAKHRYIYYECKNPATKCRVIVPQSVLMEQLPILLRSIQVDRSDLDLLRAKLLRQNQERCGEEVGKRTELNAAYALVIKEIGEVFSQRKEAEAMGFLPEIDQRLLELRRKRDDLQKELNVWHDKGNDWIDQVVRSFELIELLQEAIFSGYVRPRDMALRSIASNFSVYGEKLIPKLRSPFRQAAEKGGRPDWWAGLYDVRTDIFETYQLLQTLRSQFLR